MRYVDGFVLPVPKRNLADCRRLARRAGKIWREHGALEFRECVGDDVNAESGMPFPRLIEAMAYGRFKVLVDLGGAS